MSVFLCSIHSPGISRLPSSFPFPGSTPEYSRVHCLVLTPYQWSHGPEKRDLYDPIKPVPDPFRLSGTSQPRQKKRPPYGVHSRVNSIVSKISMEWDPVYIFPSGSSRSIIIPLCRMMLRALGQVNPRNSPYGVVLWI